MRKFYLKLTNPQFNRLFGIFEPDGIHGSFPDRWTSYKDFAIVNDMKILRKLQHRGFVTFHPDTGQMVPHWAQQLVRAYYVRSVCDEGGFCFRHGDDTIFVTVKYFDGCIHPFVVMGRGKTEDEARDNAWYGAPAYV